MDYVWGHDNVMHPILGLMAGSGQQSDVLGAGAGGTITQVDGSSPYNSTVGIRFNTDGTIQAGKSQNGAAMTWSSAGNWITPTSSASNVYDVRFTSFNGSGGGDWTTEAAIDDTWIALVDSVRTWLMNSTSAEEISFTCAFEVRDGGGAPPATASTNYTFSIVNIT